MLVERRYQRLKSGISGSDIIEAEKEWDAFEESLGGFHPKRRYWTWVGAEDMGVFIWEREWESMAEMEKTYDKYSTNSETSATARKLGMKNGTLVESGRTEFLGLWPEDL